VDSTRHTYFLQQWVLMTHAKCLPLDTRSPRLLLEDSHVGSLCLAHPKILDSKEESLVPS
jgi:hypothetical protein